MKIGPQILLTILLFAFATYSGAEDKAESDSESSEETTSSESDNSSEDVDVAAGEAIYKKSCKSCHGPKAQGMASFPKLAGNPPEYIASRLMQYRAGEKIGPNTPLMQPQAAKLSDEDIANIVGYIGSFE